MFGGFENRRDGESTKRMALSTGASIGMYGVIGLIAVVVAKDPRTIEAAKEVAVVFRPPPPPAAPPTPAPPPAPVAPQKPAAVKRVAAPAPKPLVDIDQIPDAKPAEAEPVATVYEGSEASPSVGDAPAAPVPPAPPPPATPPPPRRRDPINLPEAATPPSPDAGNVSPEYPPEAREKGLEGLVILKVVVTDKGEVTQVQVMKGEEPFVAAALAAVRSWRYTPALVEGQPTAVFRILKIPFRLKS